MARTWLQLGSIMRKYVPWLLVTLMLSQIFAGVLIVRAAYQNQENAESNSFRAASLDLEIDAGDIVEIDTGRSWTFAFEAVNSGTLPIVYELSAETSTSCDDISFRLSVDGLASSQGTLSELFLKNDELKVASSNNIIIDLDHSAGLSVNCEAELAINASQQGLEDTNTGYKDKENILFVLRPLEIYDVLVDEQVDSIMPAKQSDDDGGEKEVGDQDKNKEKDKEEKDKDEEELDEAQEEESPKPNTATEPEDEKQKKDEEEKGEQIKEEQIEEIEQGEERPKDEKQEEQNVTAGEEEERQEKEEEKSAQNSMEEPDESSIHEQEKKEPGVLIVNTEDGGGGDLQVIIIENNEE